MLQSNNIFPELELMAVVLALEQARQGQASLQGPQPTKDGRARMEKRQPPPERILERFKSKFKKRGDDECWMWEGGQWSNGYGRFWVYTQPWPAHRFSFFIYSGVYPGEFLVCHSCDTPLCVNPNHHFLGTVKINAVDMVQKSRQCKGEQCHKNKLSQEQVIEIRKRYASGQSTLSLSKEYGVSDGNVWFIVTGRTWKHILPGYNSIISPSLSEVYGVAGANVGTPD